MTNNGPYGVTDAPFSYITSAAQFAGELITCVPGAGASCAAGPYNIPSGSSFTDLPDLPSHTSVVYTSEVGTNFNATGAMTNIASISVPAGVTDPNSSNNSATDTDVPAPAADLAVTTSVAPATYLPGGTLVFTVTVSNVSGPSLITGALFGVSVNSNVGNWTVSCLPAGGATCSTTTTSLNVGSGQTYFADTVNIPPGGTAVYTVTTLVNLSAVSAVTNTSSIAVPSGVTDSNTANNTYTLSVNQ